MKKELNLTGRINSKGKLEIYSTDELNDWLSKFPGKRIQLSISVYEPGTSVAMRAYYVKKVLPDIREKLREMGEYKSIKQVEFECREISPVCWVEKINPETGEYTWYLREIVDLDAGYRDMEDLSNSELVEHLDFLKQYAAENLGLFIDDPKTLIK